MFWVPRDELIRDLQQVLAGGPPMRLALLFGSSARGTDRPDSDVDVAILPVDPELPLREDLALQARFAIIAKREVDLVRLDRCTPALRFRVAREGLSLLGEPGALSSFRARAGIEHAELAPLVKRASELFLNRLRAVPTSGGTR
jgi:predicted nucleotidyltransferase